MSYHILDVPEYLIVASRSEIVSFHLDPAISSRPLPPITGLNSSIALDYDYTDNLVLFTQGDIISKYDIQTNTITDLISPDNDTAQGSFIFIFITLTYKIK